MKNSPKLRKYFPRNVDYFVITNKYFIELEFRENALKNQDKAGEIREKAPETNPKFRNIVLYNLPAPTTRRRFHKIHHCKLF